MVDAWLMAERASEEVALIKQEMNDILGYYKQMLLDLQKTVYTEHISEKYRSGMLQLRLQKQYKLQCLISHYSEIFKEHLDLNQITEINMGVISEIDIEDYYFDE